MEMFLIGMLRVGLKAGGQLTSSLEVKKPKKLSIAEMKNPPSFLNNLRKRMTDERHD